MASIRRLQDLECHQLAVEIRREVLRLTRREPGRGDFKFVGQIRDAARSAPRNIAEGYSRFIPAEIVRYLSYAKASLHETENHVGDGRESAYFSQAESERLTDLIGRCISAILRWIEYLESPAARQFYERHKRRRQAQNRDTENIRTRP
jgi:four helix bundle protein